MKAIIVDDEPHVLAVARLLVDWEKYHIHQLFECMDATEALEIIEREQPAILLSDIRTDSHLLKKHVKRIRI